MGLKKTKKKIDALINKAIDDAYWKGWNEGWDKGYSNGEEDNFEKGWDAREENIQTRLKMLEEGYMAEGKGNKAVMVREIAELVAIKIDPENTVDW